MDVQDFSTLRCAVELIKPDVVITTGIYKKRDKSKQVVLSHLVNVFFAYQLAHCSPKVEFASCDLPYQTKI